MRKTLKVHVGNLEGYQRLYSATLKSFLRVNQNSLDEDDRTCFGFETGYKDQFKLFAIGHHLPSVSEQEASEHLFAAQQYLMLWQHVLTQPVGHTVTFTYQGVDFAVATRDKTQSVSSPEWLEMIYITIITGRYHDLELLMKLRQSGQVFYRARLQELHCEIVLHMLGLSESDNISDTMTEFTELIERREYSVRDRWVPFHGITITLGFFDVMKTVHQQDQEGYRNAMHRALEMHKEWWTHDADFRQRYEGYVSMPLLTAAKYAFEKHGFTLDFECGYLPRYIYMK